jgi:hypothetical protein
MIVLILNVIVQICLISAGKGKAIGGRNRRAIPAIFP